MLTRKKLNTHTCIAAQTKGCKLWGSAGLVGISAHIRGCLPLQNYRVRKRFSRVDHTVRQNEAAASGGSCWGAGKSSERLEGRTLCARLPVLTPSKLVYCLDMWRRTLVLKFNSAPLPCSHYTLFWVCKKHRCAQALNAHKMVIPCMWKCVCVCMLICSMLSFASGSKIYLARPELKN